MGKRKHSSRNFEKLCKFFLDLCKESIGTWEDVMELGVFLEIPISTIKMFQNYNKQPPHASFNMITDWWQTTTEKHRFAFMENAFKNMDLAPKFRRVLRRHKTLEERKKREDILTP